MLLFAHKIKPDRLELRVFSLHLIRNHSLKSYIKRSIGHGKLPLIRVSKQSRLDSRKEQCIPRYVFTLECVPRLRYKHHGCRG